MLSAFVSVPLIAVFCIFRSSQMECYTVARLLRELLYQLFAGVFLLIFLFCSAIRRHHTQTSWAFGLTSRSSSNNSNTIKLKPVSYMLHCECDSLLLRPVCICAVKVIALNTILQTSWVTIETLRSSVVRSARYCTVKSFVLSSLLSGFFVQCENNGVVVFDIVGPRNTAHTQWWFDWYHVQETS